MRSNTDCTTRHRYNTRSRRAFNFCDEPDLTPRRGTCRTSTILPAIRCVHTLSFWHRYCKTIGIYVTLVLTGAAVTYYFMNYGAIDCHMTERHSSEIMSPLRVLKRIGTNIQNTVHKCKHCKDTKLIEHVRSIVREELEHQNSDQTGKPDYALESTGAYIISTRQTESYCKALVLFGIPLCGFSTGPNALIQPGVMPGECWAFKGQTGTAVIRLIAKIYVTGVTVEHISRSISPSGQTNSAPKLFSIWGLHSPEDKEGFFFGQYTYDTNGAAVQHFSVVHKCLRMFDIIEFKVHSNHGHRDYTCIYRLRVHGELGENVPPISGRDFPENSDRL